MDSQIRGYRSADEEAVVAFLLRAWTPVFASLETALGAEIFDRLHPDWRSGQEEAVRAVLADPAMQIWVAGAADRIIGFAAVKLDPGSLVGELYMLAVDPLTQDHGIGTALTDVATAWMRSSGMRVAMIDTGGDPGHARPGVSRRRPTTPSCRSPGTSRPCRRRCVAWSSSVVAVPASRSSPGGSGS
ncbi:MAG: GNAT family N-acetyltransferase [Acidimicrobiales bacterium]